MSQAPSKPAIVLVGGFLGAGKTTLLLCAARMLAQRGLRAAVITNDQGHGLVDTRTAERAAIRADEVSGGCFCCRFSDFIAAVERVHAFNPEVIFAEAVGSCIDIVATVVRPLLRDYARRYCVAPFTVLVEPRRATQLLAPGADPQLAWLFANQLNEADLICLTRADLSEPAPELPTGFTLSLSGSTGEGVAGWLAAVLNRQAPSGLRPLREVDYERYATAEAALGWMNWQARLNLDAALSPPEIVGPFLERLDAALSDSGVSIAHLKLLDNASTGHLRASICHNRDQPDVEGMLTASPSLEHELLLNLRAAGTPRQLEAALHRAVREVPGRLTVLRLESFRPAPPEPEHRIAD